MSETRATTGTSADPVKVPPTDDSIPTETTQRLDQDAAAAASTGGARSGGGSPSAASPGGATAAGSQPAGGPRAADGPPPAEPAWPGTSAGTDAAAEPAREAESAPGPGGFGGGGGSDGGIRPNFTRAPGMAPPPEKLDGTDGSGRLDTTRPLPTPVGVPSSPVLSGPPRINPTASGSYPVVSSSAPVSAPPRVTGRASAPGLGTLTGAPPDGPVTPGGTTGGVTLRPIGPGGAGTAIGAARAGETVRSTRSAGTTPRGPRRARLSVKRIDPWSVMKFSFAVSLVLFIVVIVAASVLYLALDSMGVFTSINETVADLVESGGGEGATFRITARGVIGTAAVLGALNVLLFTSLATLGAFVYNVCADLVGGVEVTLAERD